MARAASFLRWRGCSACRSHGGCAALICRRCCPTSAAAEVIGLCSSTIGEQLYTAKVYFQTADLFAWTAVIVLLSVLFEGLFLRGVDALTERWCA